MQRYAIAGANGKMGQIVQLALADLAEFECVALITSKDDISTTLQATRPDILIDVTVPEAVYKNTKAAIELGVHPIIGTSGLVQKEVFELQQLAGKKNLGGIIAPNFSISAILMQQFSATAAKFYQHANIVEQHHPNKKDAPSGTALRTAEIIANSGKINSTHSSIETLAGALGAIHFGVGIQSIRRPGIIAKQTVNFSDQYESLEITQESHSRKSFIAGIQLACRRVSQLTGLVYGLEQAL